MRPQPRPVSIRRRILVAASALLLLAAMLLVAFIRDYAERASDRAFDRLLAASALTIAGAVQIEGGGVTVELPLASFAMFSGEDRVFYAVDAPDGRNVTGYPDLSAGLSPADDSDPVFADGAFGGERVRIATVGRLVSTAGGTGWVTIRVAETEAERAALAAEIQGRALLPVAAMTLLALALLWFGIGRAFAPLSLLEAHLRGREPDQLAPIDLPVPQEVRQLVLALNGFMGRLASARERLGGLVADAAHQVRTPLASLRAQAEMARGERDPTLLGAQIARIHDGAVQASDLVTQLLMDATITHRLETRPSEPTSLSQLVDEVIGRLDPTSEDRVALDIAPGLMELGIGSDRVALREMLRNLVDNALRYSDGPVLIAAQARRDRLEIDVLDRGPGVPDAEKEAVFERFRRGTTAGVRHGSGLGLAIVRRVAEAQRGTVRLEDRAGGGLRVRLALPLAPAPGRTSRAPGAAQAALVLATLLLASPALARSPVSYPAPDGSRGARLSILGATDTALFSALVRGFQEARPDVSVDYVEAETRPIFEELVEGRAPVPDLVMSSASDLQVKLVNDGFARRLSPGHASLVPEWAQWRSSVFGVSFEPAVIVYNPDLVSPAEVPRTHLALAELLEAEGARFAGRIATYDVARSGVGYLLASQDAAISSYFWRLASAFGRVGARVSGASPEILDRIESGEIAIGYNVLGSYAFARQAAGARIGIAVPDDYVLVLSRSLLVPKGASRPDLAESFVDFALSPAGQRIMAGPAALGAVVAGTQGPWTAERIAALGRGAVQPIAFGPSLLVGLDRQRRDRFLDTWREIVSPEKAGHAMVAP
ncbi:extracellular solute-binding protein [Aureimonas sp. AU4]|uniref:sensor histidine kinase n=1 Tax=Aureimonas sp. AU4 TaxID=1638163 RepID=UPI000786622A|nr:extracellular solute-binding protein [Aureimonas sp. AU4]